MPKSAQNSQAKLCSASGVVKNRRVCCAPQCRRLCASKLAAGMVSVFLFSIMLSAAGCSDAKEPRAPEARESTVVGRDPTIATPKLPAGLQVTVISETARPPIKRSLDIRLSRKVSEPELRTVAAYIRAQDARPYERVLILYYLPDMTPGAGAWASTFYDPDLKVKILGTSLEEEAALKPVVVADQEVLGSWIDDRAGAASFITLVKVAERFKMLQRFKDGSSMETELKETGHSEGRRFLDLGSSHGDHFLLKSNGELEIRDAEGLIVRLRPFN